MSIPSGDLYQLARIRYEDRQVEAEQRQRNKANAESEIDNAMVSRQAGDDDDALELSTPPPTTMLTEGMIDAYA